jgi:hypothetical protein
MHPPPRPTVASVAGGPRLGARLDGLSLRTRSLLPQEIQVRDPLTDGFEWEVVTHLRMKETELAKARGREGSWRPV